MRESARVAGTGEGSGSNAVGILGSEFTWEIATAIDTGEVTLGSTPEAVILGALPIFSAALFLWFREHRPGPRRVPEVVLAAQALDLCRGGSFDLRNGLEAFIAAYGSAVAGDVPFRVDLVF